MKVEIDGVKYVPQTRKIPEEAVRLLAELVREEPYKSPLQAKASRLQYLLIDMNGDPR